MELPETGGSYFVTLKEANELISSTQARWSDPKTIIRTTGRNVKIGWSPCQSGINGPLVMQLV